MNRHETLIQLGRAALLDEEAQCRLCEEERETPEHLLIECPVLNTDRLMLFCLRQMPHVPEWDPKILTMMLLQVITDLEE